MAELADALDLGSSVIDVGVQVLFPAPLLLWVVVKKVEFLGSTFFIVKQQGSPGTLPMRSVVEGWGSYF